jgi:membrane-associated phospholipid phosphatase
MVLKFLGDYSPYFFLIITSVSLMNNYDLLAVYLLGFIFNKPLNLFLEKFVFLRYNKKMLLTQTNSNDIQNNDIPSGHFQSMSYSFIFYILSHKNINPFIIFLYLFISLCTFYNCIKFKYHTIIDIISGIIFGFLFGYSYVNFSKLILKNM